MAATVSAWSKPGAWALDAEEHEEELKSSSTRSRSPEAEFPSLSAAAATKSKKKKPQTLTLGEFATYSAQPKGPTHEDLLNLPTGPRERTAEELDRSRLGGGFRSYGMSGGRSNSGGDEGRRQGGFGRDASRELVPSRADEIDNWAAGKKSQLFDRRERSDKGGFFDSHSRADDSDSWVSKKSSFAPSEPRRFGSSNGGFERERFGAGGGADSENWGRKKEERNGGDVVGEESRRFSSSSGGSDRERYGGGAGSDNWGKKKEGDVIESGAAGVGTGRPKLNLKPRSLPVASDGQQENGVKGPKGSNPFGAARPREEVLAEKGQDWKKIDEKLETMKIKELESATSGGKKSFGNGNGNWREEDKSERSWRKAVIGDDHGEATRPARFVWPAYFVFLFNTLI